MSVKQKSEIPMKSKSWGSLVWILVLWGTIRLIAELDGINWTRGFMNITILVGAIPTSCFLFFSLLSRSEIVNKKAKRYALIVFGTSPLFGIFFNEAIGGRNWFFYGVIGWQLLIIFIFSLPVIITYLRGDMRSD